MKKEGEGKTELATAYRKLVKAVNSSSEKARKEIKAELKTMGLENSI